LNWWACEAESCRRRGEKGGGGVVVMVDGWRLGKGHHTVPLGTAEGEDVQFTENPCLVEDSSTSTVPEPTRRALTADRIG